MRKILIVLAIFSLMMIFYSHKEVRDDDYDHMMLLATQVSQAFDFISDEKDRLGIENPHYSGMIGSEFTGITTTLGSYESKTTATNPNFSSAIYKYLKKMELKHGDTIALNLSSSFPSLNVQAIMTVEALGLKPIIITSIGASTFGATDLDMTYVDMEHLLYEKGLIHSKSVLVSSGGDNDLGTNMDQASLTYVTNRLKALGYPIYREEDYKSNIAYRLDLYQSAEALVNVGGNYVSHTENDIGYEMDYGLIEPSKYNCTKSLRDSKCV